MINMQEIRQKYPQYNDMSDQQLADSFHDKFYSDIPKDEFYQKIGFSDTSRGTSALQDLYQGIKDVPKNVLGITQGAGDALINMPAQIANIALPKSAQLPLFKSGEGTPYEIGKFGGDIGSFLIGGGIGEGARAAAESIPALSKAATYLGQNRLAPSMTKQLLGGALFGAAQNPDNHLQGAAIGGALGGAGSLLGGAINALRPSQLFKSQLSPSELLTNAQVAKGTETPLGDVIQSGPLKKTYENLLTKIPFSGADDQMARTAKTIVNKGQDILQGYLGGTAPQEVNQTIKNALVSTYQKQQQIKNDLYQNANKLAEESGLKLELPNFTNNAKKYTNLINDQSFLKFEPEEKALLSRLSNYKNPANGENRSVSDILGGTYPVKYPTLQEANLLSSRLNSLANKYKASPAPEDRNTANILSKLGTSLKSDIKDGIKNSGNTQLQDAFQAAETNYKKNFSQYLDKDIYQYINGNKTSDDLINTFIKTGSSNDKGIQLQKLMNNLPQKAQDLVKYSYLSRAIKGDEFNRVADPKSLRTLWSDTKLGQNQKKALMPNPEERKQMDSFVNLAKMNDESLTRMFNPKTGARNPEFLTGLAAFSAKGIPGLLGAAMVGQGASKLMTSPKIRESLINAMIKDQKMRGGLTTSAIAQTLASQVQGNQ